MASQIGQLGEQRSPVAMRPDLHRHLEIGRMDEVELLETRRRQVAAGQQIDPPVQRIGLRAGALAGVDHLDLHAQRLAQLLEQVGTGADQLLRVLRIPPEIGWLVRIAGRHQALALAGSQRLVRARQDQQRHSEARQGGSDGHEHLASR
ncbi:hypothetical protein D3C81_1528680 [compost metagenome]